MEKPNSHQHVPLISTDKIPSFEKSADKKKSFLIVILTGLDEAGKAQLVDFFQKELANNVKIQTWAPSKLLLQYSAKQGAHQDSRANIYAIANLIDRSGRTRFVVADDLTKRQLTRNCRLGENQQVSVALVATRSDPSTTTKKWDDFRVFVRRANGEDKKIQEELDSTILETLERLKPPSMEIDQRVYDVYTRTGQVLHDPDRRLFTVDTAVSLGLGEYLSAVVTAMSAGHHRLPMELVTSILSYAGYDSTQPIKMPLWEKRPNKEHLVIFLFFPTERKELDNIQSAIHDAVHKHLQKKDSDNQGMTVELIPWERHRIFNRRGQMAFWREHLLYHRDEGTFEKPVNFLLKPFRDIEKAQFGTMYSGYDTEALSRTTTLGRIIKEAPYTGRSFLQNLVMVDSRDNEIMYYPDEPFYSNPPPWLPVVEEAGYAYVSVFYITNHLTTEEDKAVQTELTTNHNVDWRNVCCYVPWKGGKEGQVDGTVEDIFYILYQVYTRDADGMNDGAFLCVDKQSGIDLTVTVVQPDWYFNDTQNQEPLRDMPFPKIRGFRYGRLPCAQAHSFKFELDGDDITVEECCIDGKVKTFRRPGWPAPGVLPYDSEDEGGDEDGENEKGQIQV